MFSIKDYQKLIRFVNKIETGDADILPNPERAKKIKSNYLAPLTMQFPLEILSSDAGRLSTAVYKSSMLKQWSSSSESYSKDENLRKEIFDNLTLAIEPESRLSEIQGLMGDHFFSSLEIESHFHLKTFAPLLPPSLTTELLSSSCPYEESKKICETHFLFCIPSYIHERELSCNAFFKIAPEKIGESNSLSTCITFQDRNIILSEDIEIDLLPKLEGKWVLFYLGTPTEIKNGYQLASFQEEIFYLNFGETKKLSMWPLGNSHIGYPSYTFGNNHSLSMVSSYCGSPPCFVLSKNIHSRQYPMVVRSL